jgi:hypothetical protein
MKKFIILLAICFSFLVNATGAECSTPQDVYKALKKIQIMCSTGTNLQTYQEALIRARLEIDSLYGASADTLEKIKDILRDYTYAAKAWAYTANTNLETVNNSDTGGMKDKYDYFINHQAGKMSLVKGSGDMTSIDMKLFISNAWKMASDKLDAIDQQSLNTAPNPQGKRFRKK